MALDLSLTEEHEELRATLRSFVEQQSDEQAVREQMTSERGFDPQVWALMAEQLGLAGLIVPEEYGGAGFGAVELMLAMEETGRALLCSPLLGTSVFAAQALLACADEATRKDLLPPVAAGRSIVSVAIAEPSGRWDLGGIGMRARKTGAGLALDGAKSWVLDGHGADVILVVARGDAGLGLFRVDGSAEGLSRTLVPSLDLTRKLAHLDFTATPATPISQGDQSEALERVLAFTLAALAAEQVGGAQACLDMATGYARTRLQFGRPIGSYQAIKHKCADMLVAVEFARSAAYRACFAAAAESDELREAAALAKSYCSETYFRAASDNLQIHGGMGFTWEHPAHLYLKRAKASELLFGSAAHHREELARIVGI